MRVGRAVALAAVVLGVACSTGEVARPEPGLAAGPVSIEVSTEPTPGAMVVLGLGADGRDVGSACVTVDRWEDGGWRSSWWWSRSSPEAEPIAPDAEVTCPAFGVPLPTRMTVVLPDDLATGTWRIAYMAADDLGAYIFQVG